MIIVACLGNPGLQYRKNRHNIGFICGDYVREEMTGISYKQQCNADVYKGRLGEKELALVYPQTYMNNSGKAVATYLRYMKMTIEELVVLHDELELGFSVVSLKNGGGHKGHNGIRSIIAECGSAEFSRIRLGIGRPAGQMGVADYVLSDFSAEEQSRLVSMANDARCILKKILETKS